MSGDRRERDLDAFLAEDGGELGRVYRKLPRTEPPRRLDRAILAEAARAVRGADARRRPRQRWLLGLGSVAGIALAAGIAWQVQRENAPGTAPVSQPAPPGVIAVDPIVPPPADPVPSPVPSAPSAASAQSTAAPPRPAASARQAPRPAAAEPLTVRAQRKAAPETAPAPPPADAPSRSEQAAAGADEAAVAERAPAAPAREEAPAADAARSRGGAVASPAPITSTELRRNMRLPPERWLDEIRRLQREGQHHWAGENLRLYRRVHPRRAIPADLEPLLDD
ncbi:MAG TPA: hypothetical protein VMR06_00900 [Dokdonella sp.]|uniref:hypothetical protein n=1 Tax=Dokdonella sp. TaxID=2291710 RepID=UPI002C694062|nr:hypothetical protein [Dokdonella sp.]HUD40536.1 hypothetical protein [Dokdonella sp.]